MSKIFSISILILFFVTGCTEKAEVEYHPEGWIDIGSDNSHMAKISNSGIEFCKECHGGEEPDDYYGGSAGISCYNADCHAGGPSGHPVWSEWMNHSSPDFHGTTYLAADRCKNCHDYYHATEASNRDDNSVGVYCTDCHTRDDNNPGQKILVDCATCHTS